MMIHRIEKIRSALRKASRVKQHLIAPPLLMSTTNFCRAAIQMAPPDALAMHQLAQQGMEAAGQLQHHDADYERERKEKR